MSSEEKNKIREWFYKNMHTHTDWTGTYVETAYKCISVDDVAESLISFIEE